MNTKAYIYVYKYIYVYTHYQLIYIYICIILCTSVHIYIYILANCANLTWLHQLGNFHTYSGVWLKGLVCVPAKVCGCFCGLQW